MVFCLYLEWEGIFIDKSPVFGIFLRGRVFSDRKGLSSCHKKYLFIFKYMDFPVESLGVESFLQGLLQKCNEKGVLFGF